MKVATMAILVTNDFPPDHGGIQRLMSRLADGLAARGREVVVVAPKLAGSEAVDSKRAYRVVRYVTRTRKLATIVSMSLSYLRALGIARERATVASIWWPAGFAVALVPRPLRGRFVVLAHGSEIAPSRKGVRRALMQFVYRQADAVLANSSFTRQLLDSAGVRNNVRTFTLGVDPRAVEPERSADPTVLSVGRLVERKGFDRLLEAVAALRVEFPTIRYDIVGEGPQSAALHALAERLGVGDCVHFLGSVADDEMWRAYARAWCFALPVRRVDDDVEGFGIVYLEAAMAALPSIGGLGSGAVDAIVDHVTGLLVDGRSTAAVVQALRTLLGDRELADRMGRAARERAREHFTWERTTDDISEALPA